MINEKVLYKDCIGCFNCINVCGKKAISIIKKDGFSYPIIDTKRCVKCGSCLKACPAFCGYQKRIFLPDVYAVRNKDSEVLMKSTSGGFFSALAQYVIDNDGYVCGAAFDNNYYVKHIITNDSDGLKRIRGVKYVQSDLSDIFLKIKALLPKHIVLFTGTPCQVHALKLFLGEKEENLITCDIICHGVPSPSVFKDYIASIKEKYGEIDSFTFRSKDIGWHGINTKIVLKSGKKVSKKDTNYYTDLYFDSLITRECCFNCQYTTVFRIGDFSMGDFWGIEESSQTFSDNKGCSLIFVNDEKARHIFSSLENYKSILIEPHELVEALQHNLLQPTIKPKNIDLFWKNYKGLK